MSNLNMKSKRIEELISNVKNNDKFKIEEFWSGIEKSRTPIIEEIKDDEEYSLVTFLYKGDEKTNNVMLFANFIEHIKDNFENNEMKCVNNTDIWYKTIKVKNDIRCLYFISPNYLVDGKEVENPEYIDDSFGKLVTLIPKDDEYPDEEDMVYNLLEFPNSLKYRWIVPSENVPKGNLEMFRMKNDVVKGEHRVWIYTPNGYSRGAEPYKVIYLTDGYSYIHDTPTVLDNLIYEGKIPSTVAVFIECEDDRTQKLSCDDDFREFITDTVMKACREKYNISHKREDNIIGGISLGGLFASYVGLKNSELFGNVLSQSGSYWWNPEFNWENPVHDDKSEVCWMAEEYKMHEDIKVKAYIEVGSLEGDMMITGSQKLRDMLNEKGCNVQYNEFQGGHDYLTWKETLADGLIYLIGR